MDVLQTSTVRHSFARYSEESVEETIVKDIKMKYNINRNISEVEIVKKLPKIITRCHARIMNYF